MSLRFVASSFQKELEVFRGLAERLLDEQTVWVLENLARDLDVLVSEETRGTLAVGRDSPAKTRPADTEDGRVYAEVAFRWEACVVREGGPQRRRARGRARRLIEFDALASTQVELFSDEGGIPLARWKTELGTAEAPGCYFHTHAGSVHWEALEGLGNVHNLAIPRHPSLFVTPMASFAFVLGELFPEAWSQVVGTTRGEANLWRSIQEQRLKQLLDWQLDQVRSASICPWMALKGANPEPGLFA